MTNLEKQLARLQAELAKKQDESAGTSGIKNELG